MAGKKRCAAHQRPVRPEAGEVKNKAHSAIGVDLTQHIYGAPLEASQLDRTLSPYV